MPRFQLFLWFMEIFDKRGYDFDRQDVDVTNFHPQLQAILAIQGIFQGRHKDSYIRLLWPGVCVSITLCAIGFQMMFVHHGVITGDMAFAIECFAYLVMLGCIPIVYGSVLGNRAQILSLIEDMNNDFQHVCNLGPRHREPFLYNQHLIWKLCIIWMSFTGIVSFAFMMFPIVMLNYQTLFATQDEHTVRPLAFPMWLPADDPYRTPNYEVFLCLQMGFSIIFVQGFCGYVYLLFHFLLHYYTMMEMIILDFQTLFEGLDESSALLPKHHPQRIEVQRVLNKRIGRIVSWHTSIFKAVVTISSVFGPPLVYQVVFSSCLNCLVFYQIAESLDKGHVEILFTLLAMASCVQLWIPCYLGTLLRNKGFAIGDACFYCGWNEGPLGLLVRTDLALVVFRAQIPIFIKFTGLPNIQLETFSSIMSSSYSYFNMLRQYGSSSSFDK